MQLLLALYAEGSSDNRFLPLIVRRTAQSIIDQYWSADQYEPIDLSDVKIIPKQRGKRDICILGAAKVARKYNLLIVHSDADDKTSERAHKERIQPGFDLVLKLRSAEEVCEHLIPLIPVQMVEAWMLADGKALLNSVGVDAPSLDLRLPKVSEVERDANPKRTLNEIVREVNLKRSSSKRTARRQEININECYEDLALNINLDVLAFVPSYQTFKDDLTKVLTSIAIKLAANFSVFQYCPKESYLVRNIL
jgi:hypothetical protein